MNMQALMKQAQTLQNDMMKMEEEISSKEFEGESNLVKVKVNGKKEILSVKINAEDGFDKEDVEMLEDMITVAFSNAFKSVDAYREEKMSKYGKIPGLF